MSLLNNDKTEQKLKVQQQIAIYIYIQMYKIWLKYFSCNVQLQIFATILREGKIKFFQLKKLREKITKCNSSKGKKDNEDKYINELKNRKTKLIDDPENWFFENSIKQTNLWIN